MEGYTSVGAGSSVVPVRFNCPPEITLHYLEKLR
jgi:predicted MPP superfamily phosphohydrolase